MFINLFVVYKIKHGGMYNGAQKNEIMYVDQITVFICMSTPTVYETYVYEFIHNMDTDTYFGMPDRECWILTM
jgi:hypothetical protein